MLNPASRALMGISGAALVMGLVYAVANGTDRIGVVLLLALTIAALVGALATVGNAVPDLAPVPDPDTPPERRAATTGAPAKGSAWPLAAAVALALLAAGAAFGIAVLLVGVLCVLVATAGWFAKVWSEHPTWTRPVRQRVSSRLLVPVALPLGTFLLAAVIAVSTSRILLAVSKNASVLIALLMAVVILLACAWVASRPRLSSSVVIAMSVLAATSMVGAGIAGAVSGERKFHHHEEHGVVHVVAKDLKFDHDTLTVDAKHKVTMEFVNKDPDYHNVAVYEGEGPDAKPIFNGAGFPGEKEEHYEFEAPPPGTYVFICDFHPTQMKGKLVAKPA